MPLPFLRRRVSAADDDAGPAVAAGEPDRPLELGDRVRIRDGARTALAGSTGEVMHVSGRRVVVRMDDSYVADGIAERLFYSYPEELERVRPVGRLGSVDLYER